MNPDPHAIAEVPYEDIRARFGAVMRAERLPTKPIKSATWYASEVACGALVHVSPKSCRLKGAVTLPEWRGYGYGKALVEHRLRIARESGYETCEVFSRHPALYERLGFVVAREANWGTVVLRCRLGEHDGVGHPT